VPLASSRHSARCQGCLLPGSTTMLTAQARFMGLIAIARASSASTAQHEKLAGPPLDAATVRDACGASAGRAAHARAPQDLTDALRYLRLPWLSPSGRVCKLMPL